MTFPKAERLLFMPFASSSVLPVAPVFFTWSTSAGGRRAHRRGAATLGAAAESGHPPGTSARAPSAPPRLLRAGQVDQRHLAAADYLDGGGAALVRSGAGYRAFYGQDQDQMRARRVRVHLGLARRPVFGPLRKQRLHVLRRLHLHLPAAGGSTHLASRLAPRWQHGCRASCWRLWVAASEPHLVGAFDVHAARLVFVHRQGLAAAARRVHEQVPAAAGFGRGAGLIRCWGSGWTTKLSHLTGSFPCKPRPAQA